ncbi:MAG TPA: squalene synthase HpnC [Planctomycetaceae bacterium]|nr:squalene synthase HpnC [Planctomycetaceae bacterium]
MKNADRFAEDLKRYGPGVVPARPLGPRAARRYCRRLARRHYENFTVAGFLLPRRLHRPFHAVYAYCRWADDLADETGDPARSMALLKWWEQQLRACYQGQAVHPVFIALGETIRRFDLPIDPLVDLLVAFRQDQRTTRYETFDQLLDYCRYSANPVGRLVLHLGGSFDAETARLSDSICTGLQLANFWQDVARDWDRGRIYLPEAHRRRFGYDESCFERRECNEAFRHMMAAEVEEAENWLRRGWPLVGRVDPDLRLAVTLFLRGGLAILDGIRRQDFDVWTKRPEVGKWRKLVLTVDSWWRLWRGKEMGEGLGIRD